MPAGDSPGSCPCLPSNVIVPVCVSISPSSNPTPPMRIPSREVCHLIVGRVLPLMESQIILGGPHWVTEQTTEFPSRFQALFVVGQHKQKMRSDWIISRLGDEIVVTIVGIHVCQISTKTFALPLYFCITVLMYGICRQTRNKQRPT